MRHGLSEGLPDRPFIPLKQRRHRKEERRPAQRDADRQNREPGRR